MATPRSPPSLANMCLTRAAETLHKDHVRRFLLNLFASFFLSLLPQVYDRLHLLPLLLIKQLRASVNQRGLLNAFTSNLIGILEGLCEFVLAYHTTTQDCLLCSDARRRQHQTAHS